MFVAWAVFVRRIVSRRDAKAQRKERMVSRKAAKDAKEDQCKMFNAK